MVDGALEKTGDDCEQWSGRISRSEAEAGVVWDNSLHDVSKFPRGRRERDVHMLRQLECRSDAVEIVLDRLERSLLVETTCPPQDGVRDRN